jgi:prophage regulatory protein
MEMPNRLIDRTAVKAMTSLPTSSLYALMAKKQFPTPVKISDRRVAWQENLVQEWINSRISAAGAAAAKA